LRSQPDILSDSEVIRRGRKILDEARPLGVVPVEPTNFLDFARLLADVIKDWPEKKKQSRRWLVPFARGLKRLEGEFSKRVEADPMMLYKPAHEVALAFHKSPAFIRYNRSANRTSKSQTGYAEHYFVATNSHPYRIFPEEASATFIIGVNFSKYAPSVFARKFVTGEPNNALSPMFPKGGKWLYRYDDRKHIVHLCCPDCAENSRAESCPHLKSTITLFSDTEGPDVLQGGQYNLGHFDEHIQEPFFDEAVERLKTVPHSCLLLTGTPLLGKSSWEHRRLTTLFNKGPRYNRVPGADQPMVSLHSIDQYSAGLVDKEKIDASRVTMDPLEQQARIFGRPAPLAKHSVFDRFAMHEMEDDIREPEYGYLEGEPVAGEEVVFEKHPDGAVRVWEPPKDNGQYIIGCDVSAGLTERDYSCASVCPCLTSTLLLSCMAGSTRATTPLRPRSWAAGTTLRCWCQSGRGALVSP
jgi:hypothetical protein